LKNQNFPCEFFIQDIIDETETQFRAFVKKPEDRFANPKCYWLPKDKLKEFSLCGIKGYKIPTSVAKKIGLI